MSENIIFLNQINMKQTELNEAARPNNNFASSKDLEVSLFELVKSSLSEAFFGVFILIFVLTVLTHNILTLFNFKIYT